MKIRRSKPLDCHAQRAGAIPQKMRIAESHQSPANFRNESAMKVQCLPRFKLNNRLYDHDYKVHSFGTG